VVLHGLPTAALEWRLVRLTGTVQSLHRSGKTWKAEIVGEGGTYLVDGLEGANIPADRLRQGATATITGIARRPRPNATERRYTILPRALGDVTVSGGTGSGATGADTSGPTPRPTKAAKPGSSVTATGTRSAASPGASAPPTAIDIDLVDLPASSGRLVRVGGLITATSATGITLDDGTAVATATLEGDARSILPQLSVGLAVNLVGTAGAGPAPRLTVASEAGVVPVAAPGASPSDATAAAATGGLVMASSGADALASDEFGLSGAQEDAVPGVETDSGGSAILIVGLLLSLALVGIVALLLRRGQPLRAMAHPLPGRRA
jgi:hypothetical protein